MEFAGFDGQKGYPRLLLGIAPVLAGWSTLALDPTMALVAQWVAFTGLWWADLRATNAGWSKYQENTNFKISQLAPHSTKMVLTVPFLPLNPRRNMVRCDF